MILKTNTLLFLGALIMLTSCGSGDQQSSEEEKSAPPNVILIYADDLGYGDLSCQGATKVHTPNIDKLAAEGRRFTDAHSVSAVCTPSRYALLTGEYPIRADSWGPLSPLSNLIIDTTTTTVGKVFQNKGYATACLGKWHLGFGNGQNDWQMPLAPGPNEVGFDYYWGVPLVNSGSPFVYVENKTVVGHDPDDPLVYLGRDNEQNLTPSPTPTFPKEASVKSPNRFAGALKAHQIYDDEKTGTYLTQKAVSWIGEHKEDPFFLYFATTNIHHPFTPAPQFKGTSQAGLYGDYIHELDWMVGEIMQSLEEHGLAENTMVIFTSDNGGMLNLGGRIAVEQGHKINGDLLGFKFGVWEGGHRVPFIVKWPGQVPSGTVSDQLISNVDMLATFAALTGQGISEDNKDSENVLPALLGEEGGRNELVLAPRHSKNLSLRKGKWMYIPSQGSGGFGGSKPEHHAWGGYPAAAFVGSQNSDMENGKRKADAPPAQLYDMANDPNQTQNVYHEYPEVVTAMDTRLVELKKSITEK
ncbi:arylsulfatase [Echinicola strongylocentroti]|uniref:Arylsulfatase n=1 Tax=Echinicola strongylocentroti TaxID=1795355 RepID=A0A2Z4IR02_9BACT|nr:sulfatase-like hydrolase/transferase [Echinicola strongylocentroti]AWW33305.1 arylsulfatase [Echinicola strongylocentroti]